MLTGSQIIDGKNYTFGSDGKLTQGTPPSETPAVTVGWVEQNGSKYYRKADGSYQTGWLKLNEKWYYFNSDGKMATGWINVGSNRYFLQKDGIMISGAWYSIDGKSYYFYASGALAVNTTINGYKVGADGAWIK